MTKLEFFERGYAQLGMEMGIIPEKYFRKFIHYKIFRELLAQGFNKSTAIEITADKTACSFSVVWRSIAYFQKIENRE